MELSKNKKQCKINTWLRLEALPSANLRQSKLEQHRQLIEQKQKQKRQQQV